MAESANLPVRLRPGASRDELLGFRDGVLRVKVSAPPVDGRANGALCRLIAKRLGVAPSRVGLLRGQKSREKLVRVDGLDLATVERRLKS